MLQNAALANSSFPPGSNVVAYVRDSGGDRQELSTLQQEQVIRQWAQDNGITIVRFFVDAARSGANVVKREAFLEMMQWLEQGQNVVAVVVWSFSRFSRSYDDAQLYLAKIRARGYQLYSLEENIPPGSVGRIVESLHLLMAEAYRVELAANVKRGLEFVVRTHKAWPHPHTPVGYRKVPIVAGHHRDGSPRKLNRLEPDPVYAPLLRKAFQMKATGATIKEIKAATGLLNGLDSYSRVFRNQIYIGRLVWGEVVIDDFCEPLIDAETWAIVQEQNEHYTTIRNGIYHPKRVASRSLLTGLAYCLDCGSILHTAAMKRHNSTMPGRLENWRYYGCTGKHHGRNGCTAKMIPEANLDLEVMTAIKNTLLDPALIAAAYQKYKDTYAERAAAQRAQLQALQGELAKVDRRISNLTLAIADGATSKALLEQLAQQEQRRDKLLVDLQDFHKSADANLTLFKELTQEELERLGQAIWAKLENGDFRTRQRLVRAIVERVDAKRLPSKRSVVTIEGNITINPAFGVLGVNLDEEQ